MNEFKIIGLLASYIDTEIRIKNFKRCLKSIKNQVNVSYDTWEILISISVPDDNLFKLTKDLLNEFIDDGLKITVDYKREKMSQFNQYKSLLKYINNPSEISNNILYNDSNTWLMFSDDDDIWHPYRVFEYEQCIKYCMDKPQYISISGKSCYNNTKKKYANLNISSSTDVDLLLTKKKLKIQSIDASGTSIYVAYCIRLYVFNEYFSKIPDKLLFQSFCDTSFANFIAVYGIQTGIGENINIDNTCVPNNWMYYYDLVRDYEHSSFKLDKSFDAELLKLYKKHIKIKINDDEIIHINSILKIDILRYYFVPHNKKLYSQISKQFLKNKISNKSMLAFIEDAYQYILNKMLIE
jgi:hypothetical protein